MKNAFKNSRETGIRALPIILASGGIMGCGEVVMECQAPGALVQEFQVKTNQVMIQVEDGIAEGKPQDLFSGQLAFLQDSADGTHIVAGASFDPGEGSGGIYGEANRLVLIYATDASDAHLFTYGLQLYHSDGASIASEADFHPDSVDLWYHDYVDQVSENFFRMGLDAEGPYLAKASAWSVSADADGESDQWDATERLCAPLHEVLIENLDIATLALEQYAEKKANP